MGWTMFIFRNSVVHVGSWAAFIGCAFWAYSEPGYEPIIGLVLGVVGIASNQQPLPFFGKKGRSLTPEQKIALRDKWRPIFKAYFLQAAKEKYLSDVIVHDVARVDEYPDVNEKEKRISSWFRVGLMGTYDRGVLLGLRWTYVNDEGNGWKEYTANPPPEAIKVMLLGAVPYEGIESFNPNGDEYYNKPHLYCHFDFGGEPYERLFYGEQKQLDESFPFYYTEMAEYKGLSFFERLRWRFRKR